MSEISESLRSVVPGRYQLERVLGRGGMATVYLAQDLKHERPVAVKVLHPELAASIAAERFLEEIGIAAKLAHPHILMLIDSGEAEGVLYYVMPYVEGSLRALLEHEKSLSLSVTLGLVQEVADALGYAHRRGLIHRDIKPENILLSEGHALVADFGIARAISAAGGSRLSHTGFPIGTLGYMSPEQAAGRTDLDERTDIYSLACVFYEAVLGEPPGMWVTDEAGKLGRFIDAPPDHRERLDVLPGGVELALVKAMRLRPEERYLTAGEFAQALEDAASGTRRYSEAEARAVVRHAAEIEAHPTADRELSLGGIQQIAAEAGIQPEYVLEAARSMEAPRTGAVRGGYFGLTGEIELEQGVDAEVRAQQFGALLQEIRDTIGRSGRVNETLNESLSWEFEPGHGDTLPRARVSVVPGEGRTRVRIVGDPGETESLLGILSVVVGSAAAAAAGAATYVLSGDLITALLAGGVVWGGQYAGFRAVYQWRVRKRYRALSGLLDRLARQIGSSATPDLPPGRRPGDSTGLAPPRACNS